MGFIDDVKWILSQIPETRQIALFSATMPGPIREIADKYLRDPHSITVERSQKVASTIRQQHIVAGPKDKVELLARLLEIEQTDGVIVFVKTKLGTVELSERLAARGFNAAALNGDIAQSQRTRTVEKLKSGEIDILVATDVAARGLDVDRISHVINYDMPQTKKLTCTGSAVQVALVVTEPPSCWSRLHNVVWCESCKMRLARRSHWWKVLRWMRLIASEPNASKRASR